MTTMMWVLTLLLAGVTLAIGPYVLLRTRRARRTHARLVAAYSGRHGTHWRRVGVDPPGGSRWVPRLVPWATDGVLFFSPAGPVLVYEDAHGRPVEHTVRGAQWLRRRPRGGAYSWIRVQAGATPLFLTAEPGGTAPQNERATWDIHYALRQAEQDPVGLDPPLAGFALERNPFTLAVAVLIGAFGIYALVDFTVNPETYASSAPYLLMVGGGALSGLAALLLLRNRGVPAREEAGLAAMVALVAAIALYPGLLRVNQLTDDQGLQDVQYAVYAGGHLRPEQPSLPEVRVVRAPEYWAQFTDGTAYTLRMRKGGLGFYQVDRAPIYVETRAFYAPQRQDH